jgi:hypothetical protein
MTTLEKVWASADRVASRKGVRGDSVFDDCGLLLQRPLKRWEYFCTPANALTFASTGGDGVHYSFLQLPGVSIEGQPVVMTVPMADRHNVVIAESLGEFLGLGYFVGWFGIEQLVYQPTEALAYLNQPDPDDWPEREELLEILRQDLAIRHVPLSLARIEQLEGKYIGLVDARDEPNPADWQPGA